MWSPPPPPALRGPDYVHVGDDPFESLSRPIVVPSGVLLGRGVRGLVGSWAPPGHRPVGHRPAQHGIVRQELPGTRRTYS